VRTHRRGEDPALPYQASWHSGFRDVALADYYYTRIYKDVEGKEKTEEGRWLDVLKKQGDKWVLIGDHGGRKSDD